MNKRKNKELRYINHYNVHLKWIQYYVNYISTTTKNPFPNKQFCQIKKIIITEKKCMHINSWARHSNQLPRSSLRNKRCIFPSWDQVLLADNSQCSAPLWECYLTPSHTPSSQGGPYPMTDLCGYKRSSHYLQTLTRWL